MSSICVIEHQGVYKKDYFKFMNEITPKANP